MAGDRRDSEALTPAFLRFSRPTPEQSLGLRRRFERLQSSSVVLEILRSSLPSQPSSVGVTSTPQRLRPDRFVLRVETVRADGSHQTYAVKGYVDDRAQRIEAMYRSLSADVEQGAERYPLCTPLAHVASEQLLIYPWVDGSSVADEILAGNVESLSLAARALARLHQSRIVPEPETTARVIAERTIERCRRLCKKWPEMDDLMQPLIIALERALPHLAPSHPAFVHGDPGPDQFIWDGSRLTLLDLDMFGYVDPAYDVGQFMTELERWCLYHPALEGRSAALRAQFCLAYRTCMPEVTPQNIAFYYGLTLLRRIIYVVRREQPEDWPRVVRVLARCATSGFRRVEAES